MSLKQSQGCRHLRCSDCGDTEDIGYWLTQAGEPWDGAHAAAYNATNHTDKSLAPVRVHETMKAAARRHIKENHMGENRLETRFKTIDEGVSELMYMQQCIDWRLEE
tara:strand:- start:1424 stop:1744 length:321 start_codon:yes stop_codon:yes gene_type:complete